MPLPKRVIEPIHVARNTLPDNYPLPSELEGVTNGTLANIVRQLSSLSRHAEDLFGELNRDALQVYDRSNSLQARIDRLAIKVTQLDSNVEEVSLQDIHMRKAFKSANGFDQEVFSRATMPQAMLEIYKSCDRPPPLDKLNVYRDDGKDGLKFYTDPNYFFDLWKQEMLNDTERMMHDRGKKVHRPRTAESGQGNSRHNKKRVRQPHNTRERQKQAAREHGEYIMPQNTIYRSPEEVTYDQNRIIPNRPNSIEVRRLYQEVPDSPIVVYEENPYQHGLYGQGPLSSESLYQGGTPTRRPSQPPPAPPSTKTTPLNTPTRVRGRDNLPPPPPPPAESFSPPRTTSPAPEMQAVQELPPPPPVPKQALPIPPPPPPPPMPIVNGMNGAAMAAPPNLAKILSAATSLKLKPVKDRQLAAPLEPMVDPRNDLLKAIRDGIKLRKVEKIEQKEVERGNGLHDVASILARRVAVEFSDSESGSDSECDSEGWGENETSA